MKELPIPAAGGAPSGPKQREWGKPQQQQQGNSGQSPEQGRQQHQGQGQGQGFGKGAQGYSKPVGFVKAEDGGERGSLASRITKTDEELEAERREARRRDEENSYRDVSYVVIVAKMLC